MKPRLLAFVLIVSLVLLARTGVAELVVVGQDRRAVASAFVSSAGDFDAEQFTEVAPDEGPFDVSLSALAEIVDGSANAAATQFSTISPAMLHAEGSVSAHGEVLVESATAYALAQSNIAIRFTLTEPATFSLVGFIEGQDQGTVTVQLARPFETVAWFSADGQRVELGHTGMLEADTYDINVTSGADGSASEPGTVEQGVARYDVSLLLGQGLDAPVIAAPSLRAAPNPFRGSVRLTVPEAARGVRILDARGRVVRTLPSAASVLFDGRDETGRSLASGVYWVEPVGLDDAEAIKVVRIR